MAEYCSQEDIAARIKGQMKDGLSRSQAIHMVLLDCGQRSASWLWNWRTARKRNPWTLGLSEGTRGVGGNTRALDIARGRLDIIDKQFGHTADIVLAWATVADKWDRGKADIEEVRSIRGALENEKQRLTEMIAEL